MSKRLEHSIWAEKYRPDTLETYIGNEEFKAYVQDCVDKNDIQHLIFHGKTGTGKTTAAKILYNTLDCDFLYINGSDENGIDIVREKIKTFASTASFKKLKVIVLDDCQNFTPQAQQALLNIIETYSKTTRFIFTCNALGKLIPALQSRCEVKRLEPPDMAGVAGYLADVLDKENVSYQINDLVPIVQKFFPDIRKCLNVLQSASKTGAVVITETSLASTDYIDEVIGVLKDKGDKFALIRQIIADNGLNEFTDVYRALYDRTSEFAPKHVGEVCLHIAEGEYESNFVPDREITFMKVIHNIISLK